MDELELRKYCVEKAIVTFKGSDQSAVNAVDEVPKLAEALFKFLNKTCVVTTPANSQNKIITKKLEPLTDSQRKCLQTAIKIESRGDVVNGSAIARELGMSQGCMSGHLRKLVSNGYMSRDGNSFYVKYKPDGEAYSPTVRKFPAAAAKGYNLKDNPELKRMVGE